MASTQDETQLVQEYVHSAGRTLRVDAERGILRGVKLLGLRSRNGRRYEESALRKSIGLYEGSKVNVNHPTVDPLAPRDYRDRLGVVRNVRLEAGAGLFGDLHYNPNHPLAEQLAWDAEHVPENVGLSHNVLARTRGSGKDVVVEAITRVQSVDLVADPATTAGLFEQQATPAESETSSKPDDLATRLEQVQEELQRSQEQLARAKRRVQIEELLREHELYGEAAEIAMTEAFLRSLMAVEETGLEPLIDERIRFARAELSSRQPRSCEQRLSDDRGRTLEDTASFVEAVSRRV